MKILHTIQALNTQLAQPRKEGLKIGLVPTMGALHQGHISLVKAAKKQVDIVLVSIFVNPTQFNNPEDLKAYPRTIEEDTALLLEAGVDIVFAPEAEEMYPLAPMLKFDFGYLESILEGAFRPGHFNGVGVVVSKLFNITMPDFAFFGQKDLQQVAIIRKMVEDLSFQLELVIVPTVREEDGLALSSRNRRLSMEDRAKAILLSQQLREARVELLAGRSWFDIQIEVTHKFDQCSGVRLEYFELVKTNSLEIASEANIEQVDLKNYSLCTAAFVGDVRLIDNLPI